MIDEEKEKDELYTTVRNYRLMAKAIRYALLFASDKLSDKHKEELWHIYDNVFSENMKKEPKP